MEHYEIWTDSSADIAPAAAGEIRFVPMSYTVGDETRISAGPETEDTLLRFYRAQREGKATRTSQITPQQYKDAFIPSLESGKDVIYISLSSGLTETFNSVNMAKRDLDGRFAGTLYPVDSLAATGGMGLLCERAVMNRREGMSAEENARDLCEAAGRLCHVFMVDDLMFLKRGGRIPAATALVGTMLSIKPILIIAEDGSLATVSKKRGTAAGVKELCRRWRETRDPAPGARVYTTHTDAAELSARVKQLLLEADPSADVTSMLMCPVIGSHVGPGTVTLIYFGDRKAITKES